MRYAQSFALILAFGMLLSPSARCAQPPPTPEEGRVLHWRFDGQPINGPEWHGEAAIVPGVRGDALGLDGATAYAIAEAPAGIDFADARFSFCVWVNPYVRTGGQQMILAKSVYALDQREWSLLLEPDGRAGFYLRREGWLTATSDEPLPLGHWSHLVVSVGDGQARLFVNGQLSGQVGYQGRGATTDAPISVGGLNNDGDLFQMFRGAIDEVAIYDRPLSPAEIEGMYQPMTDTHPVPEPAEPIELWDPRVPFPEVDTIPLLDRVTHVVVHRARVGEYEFLHGAAIIEHDGVMHATWANSPVEENSAGEIQRGRRSSDGGLTWGPPEVIAPGFEGERRHSHGVLAEQGGELWAFAARFGIGEGDTFPGLQTEAFVLDGDSGEWVSRGIAMDDCWPYDQPKRLPDGNYITGGQDKDRQPCVAISHGDDFTNWDTVKLPVPPGMSISFGETTVLPDGDSILAITRPRDQGVALVSTSDDGGHTWTPLALSNYPMADSKPYVLRLSTGQRCLVSNWPSRDTLLIAVSEPGETLLSHVHRIRHGRSPSARGSGHFGSSQWSYPYAYEHDGSVYVVYSITKEDCGLSIIPLEALEGQ